MKTYWWNEHPNFGDRLAPYILSRFAGIQSQWAPLDEADNVVTGSVLHHIGPNWSGTVLGAGLLRADLPIKLRDARVLALRGPMTLKYMPHLVKLGAMGDPGLLADELVEVETRTWDVGILPHWSDTELASRKEFYNPKWTTRVISPGLHPLAVVRSIGQCRKLVTSSLHGVIVADGFGIPRRIEHTRLFNLDTMFKFQDYLCSIGEELVIGEATKAHRGLVEARKHELYDVFESLRPKEAACLTP